MSRLTGIPLALAGEGRKLTITGIAGGCGLQRRLADLGLVPGACLTVRGGRHPGPLVIEVRGSRLGLGFGVAQKITVQEVENVR